MKDYKVYIEDSRNSMPRQHEEKTARMLAYIFKSDIVFMRRSQSKTPDLYILKLIYVGN